MGKRSLTGLRFEETSASYDVKENLDMEMSDKELWSAIDKAVFGTDDVEAIAKSVGTQLAEWERLESSLGGFLFLLRERRRLTVPRMASEMGVPVETWEMWEGDVCIPTGPELDKLVSKLELWEKNEEKLRKLWHQSSFQSLRRVVQFRPELLAARGVAGVTAQSQWALLHPEAQKRFSRWAEKRGFSLPVDLFELLDSLNLESKEEQTEWAREVWNADE